MIEMNMGENKIMSLEQYKFDGVIMMKFDDRDNLDSEGHFVRNISSDEMQRLMAMYHVVRKHDVSLKELEDHVETLLP